MRWFTKREADAEPAPRGTRDYETLARLAHEHLSADDAQRWLGLLRPALSLAPARSGEPVVARLGGAPLLPADAEWPVWEGTGPLSYVGELHCAAIDPARLDITLPAGGRLLFFYFDGSYDDAASIVIHSEPETAAGARVLYVPDGVPVAPRPAPEGVQAYPEGGYAGHPVLTAPDAEHPLMRAAFPAAEGGSRWDHPVFSDAFSTALDSVGPRTWHQVGGYAFPVQGPVEYEVASFALPGVEDDAALEAEAVNWTLLLQVDSDGDLGMMWGDAGTLYWLARRDRLDGTPPTDALFTWQCS